MSPDPQFIVYAYYETVTEQVTSASTTTTTSIAAVSAYGPYSQADAEKCAEALHKEPLNAEDTELTTAVLPLTLPSW